MRLHCFTLMAVMICSLAATAKNDLTPVQKASIATRFASEVKYNFAGYDRFAQDFDSICRAELPLLVATESDEEFGRKLTLMANRLKDGHTSISWSADVAYAPIMQKRIGDKVFVTGVYSDLYSQKGVRRGTEIVAIDDMPVIEYGEKCVMPYIASSTPQWARAFAFNSINLTKGERGKPVKLTFRNGKEKPFDITDNRQSPWNTVNIDDKPRFELLAGNIGLLTLPSFRYMWKDDAELLSLYKDKIMPTDGLIVDIRENTGGNSRIGDIYMQLIATDTIPQGEWLTPKYQAAYAAWGKPWECDTIQRQPVMPFWMMTDEIPRYDKPVVLLVSGMTFSAAENFTALFRNARRGKIIGTPTGGSTGQPMTVDLGWGYYGRICTRNEKLADGTEFIGKGIQPDIVIEETESVFAGKDNVIEAALKELKQ